MKKLLALVLALSLVFCFAGCGTSPEDVRGEQQDNTASDKEFSMGAVEGLTYENKFIGIGCKLSSDWAFYTDEEIKELNNLSEEIMGDELTETIKEADIVYDMYASTAEGDTININLEKATALQVLSLDLKENFKAIFDSLKTSFEGAGFTDVNYELSTVKIGDKDFDCMNITMKLEGVTLYETLISIKCSNYLASIAVASIDKATVDSALASFYLVD